MMKRIYILFGFVLSCGNALPCEKLNTAQIKDYYFSTVASDVERIGMLCLSENSKINDCTQKDKNIIQNHWNNFVKNSNLQVVGRVLVNKKDGLVGDELGSTKICSYYVRVSYSLRNEIAEIDDQLIPVTKLIFMEKYLESQKKLVTGLEKNNWLRINIQDTISKNGVGQEWLIAPVLWTMENFTRYSTLNRAYTGLSNESIDKFRHISGSAEGPGWENIKNYFNRQYN